MRHAADPALHYLTITGHFSQARLWLARLSGPPPAYKRNVAGVLVSHSADPPTYRITNIQYPDSSRILDTGPQHPSLSYVGKVGDVHSF